MFELFSDIFSYRDNFFTRLDARVKLALTLLAVLCVVLSSRTVLPCSVFAAALTLMLALGIPPRFVFLRLIAPLAMSAMIILAQSLLIGKTPFLSIPLPGHSIPILKEGFHQGILTASRVLAAANLLMLFGSVTPAHQAFQSLRWFRFPREWVEIAMLTYRYVFVLLDEMDDVLAAQRMRLGHHGAQRRLRSMGALAGTVVIRSLDQATRTHEAMTLRGYSGAMPFGALPSVPVRQRWMFACAALAFASAYWLAEWGART